MNTTVNDLPATALHTRPLWAAIGVLGVAVLALGASLVHVQTRPADGHVALAAMHTPPVAEVAASGARVAPAESLDVREDLVAPPARAAAPAPRPTAAARPTAPGPAPTVVTTSPPVPALPQATATAPVVAAVAAGGHDGTPGAPAVVSDSGVLVSQAVPVVARALCSNCGTVEGAIPVQRSTASGIGVGAVAGGALGAVVGNQIGKGSGRTLATVLGAVGGGIAGNAIERNMKKETVYQVQVRMDDGSLRTLEQASPASIGARVTVDGDRLDLPGQSSRAPAQPELQPAPRPVTVATYPPELNR